MSERGPAPPAAVVVVCVLTLVYGVFALIAAPIHLYLMRDPVDAALWLLNLGVAAAGAFASISALARHVEAYGRLSFYAGAARNVSVLEAFGGLFLFAIGLMGSPELSGYGCSAVAASLVLQLWYLVVRWILRRPDVLATYGVEAY
jgi:hypothetical protein